MPKIKIGKKMMDFPYTGAGKKAAKKAMKKDCKDKKKSKK